MFVALRERTGSGRLDAAALPFALEQLDSVLAPTGAGALAQRAA